MSGLSATGSDVVALIGNGLPIAVNADLRLDILTRSFLDRHAEDRTDLNRLLAEVKLGEVDPTLDFEGVVAGIEAAEEVVSAFMGLASRSGNPDLRDAAAFLQEKGVPALVRRLYYAYCAEILNAIGEGARVGLGEDVLAFATWLRDLYRAHGRMGLFTLNYDVLIERLFVADETLGLGPAMTDFFSGLDSRMEQVSVAAGTEPLIGRLFYPEDPPGRPIHLHHLHGCLTHFRRRTDGSVMKFGSAEIRQAGVFERLAVAEDSDYSPSVILGSRKVSKSREWPFAFGFLELERRTRDARTIVVAGYSFRDEAVNTRLQAAAASGERRWIIINRKSGAAATSFEQLVGQILGPAKPEFVHGGIAGSLPNPA